MKSLTILSIWLLCLAASAQTKPDFALKPAMAWQYKTGDAVFSSPVIEGTVVYTGSNDKHLYALDLQTGTIKWKFATGGEVRSTPVVYANKIFFVSGDGLLYCLDKNNGTKIWTFKTAGERKYELFSFADYYQSSPVLSGDIVYFGSGDNHIYAVNTGTGNIIWKYKTGSVVHGTPALNGDQLYIGSFDGNVYALNKNTGKLFWKFKSVGHKYFPKGEMQGTPLVFNGLVFIASRDYNLYAIDEKGGYCHWNRKFPKGWAMGKPAIHDSVLYVGTSDDFEMHALDPYMGVTIWKTNVKFNIFGGMAFTNAMGYFGSLQGKLFGVDLKTGAIQWTFETDAYKQNRSVYFNEQDAYHKNLFGRVIKANEDFLTLYHKMGGFFSTPAIQDNYLVVTSLDGNIYCFKKD